VTWTVTNPSNDLSGAKVVTVLPTYVDWRGTISPTTEKVTYDDKNRTVTWDLGSVPARTGYDNTAARELSFQVTMTPSLSQINNSPNLTGVVTLNANDDFTNTNIQVVKQGVTTKIDDPGALEGSVAQ
jgi:hypothetical protein